MVISRPFKLHLRFAVVKRVAREFETFPFPGVVEGGICYNIWWGIFTIVRCVVESGGLDFDGGRKKRENSDRYLHVLQP